MEWYQQEHQQTLDTLQSTETGLSSLEAQNRLTQYGLNKLADEEKISRLQILLHQFKSPLIYILLIAALVTLLLKEYIDSGVILAVVLLNAVIGYLQEFKAEESVRALKNLLVAKARVIRDGHEQEIPGTDLVPGDIVLLASGNRVPADLRLLHDIELRIDEAMLTGESLPADKTTAVLTETGLPPADQTNMAFMGTAVVNGRARGVVVATGARTILGTIAGEVRSIGQLKAPIQHKIEQFAHTIGLLVLGAAGLLFMIGLLLGETVKTMFMVAVAAAVATIPEGLPIVVTIAMAVGVARMAKHNAIIRKLPAVETLGSTTVICSDKTGTLTRNEMTVTNLYDGRQQYQISGTGYEPEGQVLLNGTAVTAASSPELALLQRIGLLCNESDVYEEEGRYKVDGDPTEGALITAAMKAGLQPELEKEQYGQLAMIPFESERGYMATLHQAGEQRLILLKGAPEQVLEMCATSPQQLAEITLVATAFAAQGMRVLAFAWKEAAPDQDALGHHDTASGLTFAGLQGMIDPPRPEAIEAIDGCKKAGIRVVMITGDHAVTAQAIGRQLGIIEQDDAVLTGRELEAMDDDALFEKVRSVSVFARVAPDHKLRITRQLIRHGQVVAMTGDGVNDAPALKAAHIGVAMGITGTDVAKEASDMVLTDDNFASIFSAVREGRIVFDNLRKVTFFLLPTGIASIISIIITMIMGMPIPYLPAQLLWINLVTNGLQDVAMAFEPGEKGILKRPPRNPLEGIMSRLLIQRTVLVGMVIALGVAWNYTTALQEGNTLENARTVAVTTMVFFQFFQAWNSRSEYDSIFRINPLGNPFLFYSMIAAVLAQLAFIYAPPLQWVFRTVPLTATEWVRVLAVAASVLVVVELDKWLRRRSA
ncbi:cation-translocating P-type ATPase [Trichlorobacter lovleyi]|uniref:cation-translocating P-type ATPase n=1 Tax=Trichlorobacter lovleyi TaxID=313985 RepID=UPI0023F1D85A|nr:HAD-IC family P-type ATPase [Trichlorobacter lovleyi]